MKQEITLNVATAENELIIREGAALPLKEPVAVRIKGVLNSPFLYLEKQLTLFDPTDAQVIVNRQNLSIVLTINPQSVYATVITGTLELHPLFEKFGINSGRYLSNFDMAQLFKMNRTAFETQAEAMKLVSELQNFRAKVDREIEKLNDNRGNKRDLVAQTVESNLPDTFNLKMPIFKGTNVEVFPVEVYIKPDDFSCTLISPVANDLIEEMRDSEMDAVIALITELAPGIVIIEQ